MTKNTFFLLLSSTILASCASTHQYVNIPQQTTPQNDTIHIYVLRPSSMASAIKFKIYHYDELIGKLGPQSYLLWKVAPERDVIRIISKAENTEILSIDPQPGKTYYVKQQVKLGIAIAQTGLELLEEEEGQDLLKKLKAPKFKDLE